MQRSLTAVLAADVVGYSRLMSEDATATLATLRRVRTEILAPVVSAHGGRVVKSMGDGWIVIFPAVSDAVTCALEVQDQLQADGGFLMRTGIHIGDVTEEEGDVFGDGVNVAARLQDFADPGAVAVTDAVHSLLDGTLRHRFDDTGEHTLKNISRPVRIWSREVGSDEGDAHTGAGQAKIPGDPVRPRVRFATTDDGLTLAYATSGHGPGLVRIGHFPSHLELDWKEDTERQMFRVLEQTHTLVRFDQRGTGLSDLDLGNVSFEQVADDARAVADAASLDKFAVFGSSGSGSATALHLAARYPDRVSAVVILGGFVEGRSMRVDGTDPKAEPIQGIISEGWDHSDLPFVAAYLSLYFPDANPQKIAELARLVQAACPRENALVYRKLGNEASVAHVLADIRAPTLILHSRGDAVHPVAEGRKLARGIADAEMVVLESANHYPLPGEPAWREFETVVREFLDRDRAAQTG